MLQALVKQFFGFPQVAFWMAIIVGPTVILASVFIHFIVRSKSMPLFPTIDIIFQEEPMASVARWGNCISAFSFIFVCYTCHKFIYRIKVKNPQSKILKPFLIVSDSFSVVMILMQFLLSFILEKNHQKLFYAVLISYFMVSISFYVCIDYFSTKIRKSSTASWGIDVIVGFAALFALMFLILGNGLDIMAFCVSLGGFCECLIYVFLHVKVIFVGIIVLGARFLPSNFEALRRNSSEEKILLPSAFL